MNKKALLLFFVLLCCIFVAPIKAHADMGPKPSVEINFSGLDDRTYYVTLLSKRASTGPWSANFTNSNDDEEEADIKDIFRSYVDSDGYYFLNYYQICKDNASFKWGYYPPGDFKLLIYFPDNETFSVSELSYTRYAFNSYYKVNYSDGMILIKDNVIFKNYDFSKEILNLVLRIIITIIIEIGIAFLFMFKSRRHLFIITITNIITQIILNAAINIINYFYGIFNIAFTFFLLEFFVFFIEAFVYAIFFKEKSQKTQSNNKKYNSIKPVLYAFTANAISMLTGIFIYIVFPNFLYFGFFS